jgi:TolA-binding protein
MKYFLLAVLISLTVLLNAQTGAQPKSGASSNSGGQKTSGAQSQSSASKGGDDKNIEKYPKWKWRRKLKMARRKMKEGSYYIAVKYLEDAYKDKQDKVEIMHLLGEANRYLRDYDESAKYYHLEMVKDSGAYPSDRFYMGQMEKSQGKYDDAKRDFQLYLKTRLD